MTMLFIPRQSSNIVYEDAKREGRVQNKCRTIELTLEITIRMNQRFYLHDINLYVEHTNCWVAIADRFLLWDDVLIH